MKMFPMLLLLLSINVTNAFNIIPSFSSQCKNFKLSPLFAVTEEDVLFMVERAESLWEEALNARKWANALSDRAEEGAEAAAFSAEEVDKMMREGSISFEKIEAADAAVASNIDAGSTLNKALEASEQADRLEAEAEEALERSEAMLEQHLIDFPHSDLAF